jgi:SIR2-like domain
VTESDWATLMERIQRGRCTPFLGAGAAHGSLPLGSDIARGWASEHSYPLPDPHDLARVAQYIGIRHDAMRPKELIESAFAQVATPDFADPHEPHRVLADLPLPLYITTNYDDFMIKALRSRNRNAQQEVCRWNDSDEIAKVPSPLLSNPGTPLDAANPVVFHLHGHLGVLDSIVLTEDDYLDFLVAISRGPMISRDPCSVLPHQIAQALSGTSLLFIGYALQDWDFRVLHRGLVATRNPSLRRFSVAVQLELSGAAEEYVERYFHKMDVSVFWGDARAFCTELRQRWEAHDSS